MYFLAFDFGILLSLNLIFYIVLGLAVLFGFLSGFKKSLFKLITMAIYYIVFFTTLNLMANVLWSADLSFAVPYLTDFLPELSGFTSFEASYESLLPLVAGDSIDTATLSPEFIELFASLMIFVLKIVWTVLYFTVLLVIYKFICFIIRIIFFKNKKDKEHKKSRLFGALVGAGNGALALFIMIVMMGGVMSSMDSLLKLMTSSTTLMEETS
ncbi:MAG: hypothetical protein RBR66_04540, partial [Candidatus Izemoplasmatales bacterium]|nr:hypothetical protein [Candidatus Izemoplasmatales bacterium]